MIAAELQHVGMVADGRRLLDDVCLRIGAGERLALMGPNGSGKSLLLRILCGLVTPSEGRVSLFGRDMSAAGSREWAEMRRRMGVAFQGGGLLRELSVADNVAYPLLMRPGATEASIKPRLDHALVSAGLYRVGKLMPWQLSAGQLRLAALARAAVTEPDLLVVDDLFAGMDAAAALEMEQRFAAVRPDQSALLFITQDPARAERLAQRVVVLDRGVLTERS